MGQREGSPSSAITDLSLHAAGGGLPAGSTACVDRSVLPEVGASVSESPTTRSRVSVGESACEVPLPTVPSPPMTHARIAEAERGSEPVSLGGLGPLGLEGHAPGHSDLSAGQSESDASPTKELRLLGEDKDLLQVLGQLLAED